jgi:UDP-glucose 4-epimerase
MTEEHPFNNRTFYGATKIAGEQMCRAFYERYGLNYIGLRYMNVYGPRQDYKGAYVAVIMKILDRIEAGLPPIIYGDGSQSYDFIYVKDAARANICALKSKYTDEFYNIGTGKGTTIKEMCKLLLELTNSKLNIKYEKEGKTFVTHRIGSTEKAGKEIGFVAKTPLREGLKELIVWRRRERER